MTKIIIKSFKYDGINYDYRIFVNKDSIQWAFYTFLFRNIYNTILNKSNIGPFSLDYYEDDIEITSCFCLLFNRTFNNSIFEIGSSEECIYPYQAFSFFYKDYVPLVSAESWTYFNSKIYLDKMNELRNKFNDEQLKTWEHLNLNYCDYDEEELYNTAIILNRYRYSKFIEHLIDDYDLDVNSYIPMVSNREAIFGINDDFPFNYPYSIGVLFDYDIYPLDLAYLGRNESLLKKLIERKARKYSKMGYDSVEKDSSNLIGFILETSNSIEQIDYAKSLLIRGYATEDELFRMDGNYWHNITNHDRMILGAWYFALVRLGDINLLEKFISQYKKQIFTLLGVLDPYTAQLPSEVQQEQVLMINQSMIDYINKQIIPQIEKYRFVDNSYKNQGIWGFDARTGRPIKETDLYI